MAKEILDAVGGDTPSQYVSALEPIHMLANSVKSLGTRILEPGAFVDHQYVTAQGSESFRVLFIHQPEYALGIDEHNVCVLGYVVSVLALPMENVALHIVEVRPLLNLSRPHEIHWSYRGDHQGSLHKPLLLKYLQGC